MTAVESLWMVAVVALKVAFVALGLTVTDTGTVRRELLLDRVTVAPPAGAAWVRETVQELEALDPRLEGLHSIEETRTAAARVKFVLAELLL